MKKTVPLKRANLWQNIFTKTAVLGCALILAFSCPASAGGAFVVGTSHSFFLPPGFDTSTIHNIQVFKAQSSKKHKIRLYPDARQQVLFFSVDGKDGKVYQLYLFDMDGKLVNQTSIRNRETTVLANISEGDFLFEVFTDDERIENGRLTVK